MSEAAKVPLSSAMSHRVYITLTPLTIEGGAGARDVVAKVEWQVVRLS